MAGGSSHSLGSKGLSERSQSQHLPAPVLGSALVEAWWPLAGVCWPQGEMLWELCGVGLQTCCWDASPRVGVAGEAGVLQLKGAQMHHEGVNNA